MNTSKIPSRHYASSSIHLVRRFAAHRIRASTLNIDKGTPRSAMRGGREHPTRDVPRATWNRLISSINVLTRIFPIIFGQFNIHSTSMLNDSNPVKQAFSPQRDRILALAFIPVCLQNSTHRLRN